MRAERRRLTRSLGLSCVGVVFGLGCAGLSENGSAMREAGPSTTSEPLDEPAPEPEMEPEPEREPEVILGVPAGCEDVLVGHAELPQCDGQGCEVISTIHAQRAFHLQLYLRRYYFDEDGHEYEISAVELARHTECVLQQLANLGFTATVSEQDRVVVDASYEQVRSALHTTAVHSLGVSCTEENCPECNAMDEPECRGDPGCWPLIETRFDPERNCRAPGFAGCLPNEYGGGCGASITNGVAPDGTCWSFSSTCQPQGFSGRDSQDPQCGYARFEGLAACPP
jgi:hypothetical protein